MSQEELKKSTEENLKWLSELVPTFPDLSFIEPTIQAFALFNKSNEFTEDELIIIGISGLIATKARLVNDEKFQNITPPEYFHHAYILFKLYKKEDPSEDEYLNLMKRLYK